MKASVTVGKNSVMFEETADIVCLKTIFNF
jgi:hypothetical protein